jgi:hypothetical protein
MRRVLTRDEACEACEGDMVHIIVWHVLVKDGSCGPWCLRKLQGRAETSDPLGHVWRNNKVHTSILVGAWSMPTSLLP